MKQLLVGIFCILTLAACSSSPSETRMTELIQSSIPSDIREYVAVRHLKKLNGVKKDNTYKADVEYDIIFKKSFHEISDKLKSHTGSPLLERMKTNMFIASLRMNAGNFKAGYQRHVQQKIAFIKSENGWILDTDQ